MKISNIESNRVGICLGPIGVREDNYLNTDPGIMESRQDFNQFHIWNINEEIINAMGWNARPGQGNPL